MKCPHFKLMTLTTHTHTQTRVDIICASCKCTIAFRHIKHQEQKIDEKINIVNELQQEMKIATA